jgi:hypothetical protein
MNEIDDFLIEFAEYCIKYDLDIDQAKLLYIEMTSNDTTNEQYDKDFDSYLDLKYDGLSYKTDKYKNSINCILAVKDKLKSTD